MLRRGLGALATVTVLLVLAGRTRVRARHDPTAERHPGGLRDRGVPGPERARRREHHDARGDVPDRSPDRVRERRAGARVGRSRSTRRRWRSRSRATAATSPRPCRRSRGRAARSRPGTFQRFPVSMGPLPDVDSLEFKAAQTYSSGEVVRWIEPRTGDAEPEHPAPMLTLAPAAQEDDDVGDDGARDDRDRRRDHRRHRHAPRRSGSSASSSASSAWGSQRSRCCASEPPEPSASEHAEAPRAPGRWSSAGPSASASSRLAS